MTIIASGSQAPSDTSESNRDLSILLFAAEPLASEVARSLCEELSPHVLVIDDQIHCLEALRERSFDLLVLEDSVTAIDTAGAEVLYDAAGTAVVVEVNFGIMQADRIVLAAQTALRRRRLDLGRARTAARADLHQDLIAPMTGLLLEAQLALRQAGPGVIPALDRLVDLAEHLCSLLRVDDDRAL